MTTEQIKYFMEVAYTSNFTVAAEHLFVAQPNLTRGIISLEKELGIKLFDRSTRKVKLTDAGVKMMAISEAYFSPFLKELGNIQSEAANDKLIMIGVLHDENIPRCIQDVVCQKNKEGDYKVFLRFDSNANLYNGLTNRQYDLVITSDHRFGAREELMSCDIADFQMLLAYRKDHPCVEGKRKVEIKDFADETIFFSPIEGPDFHFIQMLNTMFGKSVSVQMVDSHENALMCASMHAGVAVIPSSAPHSRNRFPNLEFMCMKMGQEKLSQQILWRKEETNTHVLKMIEDMMGKLGDNQQE